MRDFAGGDQSFGYGWSGHGVEGGGVDDGMSGLGSLGTMSGAGFSPGDKLDYQPSLAPTGTGVGYWPGDVRADALALDFVGDCMPYGRDQHYGATDGAPSTGTQAGDMSAQAGAWDPQFKGAVSQFQAAAGLKADGWIGPQTRQVLAQMVATQNAGGGYCAPSGANPLAPVVPVAPGVAAPDSSGHGTLLALGAATLAAIGAWWYLRRHHG